MNSSATMSRSNEPEDIDVHNRSEHPGWAPRSVGWIEVIAGSMFSGKSEALDRRLRRAKVARQKVQVFKPEIDERYSNDHIVSHSEMKHESANVRTAADVRANVEPDTEVVGIDEAQFFDNELIQVVNELAAQGKRVIVAGLDQDYTGKPWEPMPQLLAVSEDIAKKSASCMNYGEACHDTQRTLE